MAVPNPQLRYATDTFNANGITTDWEVSFTGGYINASYIYAYSVSVDPLTSLETGRTNHTTSVISESADAATVRVTPAVAAGRKLYIYRSTPVGAMLVNYSNGSLISKANLNLSNEQLLDIIQELLDNVNLANATAEGSIGTIINIRDLINEVYNTVTQMLQNGGIISVTPRTWSGTWADDTSGDFEFDMPGADVSDAGFYDVYVNGIGQEPNTDYTVVIPTDVTINPYIRFAAAPLDGSVWFAVLRGYAKPYQSAPITQADLRIKMVQAPGPTFYVDKTTEFGLVRCTYATGCEVTVNPIPVLGSDLLGTGSYMSIRQVAGAVTVIAADGVNLIPPTGCLAATRGVGSVITLVCDDADTNTWFLSGDLAKEA